ncbi:hypothetical protein [Cellvibrio fibrivorans]|uniref:Uncharacterized protein n=1 Tax=Cellvibrio fibrivorans TaxID=126350 RepID=A0ABU1V4B9_9GAMM|nr:hypothetical protein [Cellvibrio fibrivorans]MDR7092269.1 hypothetical protein [Cellvibrio fibrivorans]
MRLKELEESYLLSLRHDDASKFVEFTFITSKNLKVNVSAWNDNLTPIVVEYIGLNLVSNFTNHENIHCLGEIESINTSNSGFTLEGNIGCIKVTASNLSIEPN